MQQEERKKCCDHLWGSRPLRHLPVVPDSLFLALAKTWVPSLQPEAPSVLRGTGLRCCAGGTWCPRAGWQGPWPSAGCSPADAGRVPPPSGGFPCGEETVLKRRGYSAGGGGPQDLTRPVRQQGDGKWRCHRAEGGGRRAPGAQTSNRSSGPDLDACVGDGRVSGEGPRKSQGEH